MDDSDPFFSEVQSDEGGSPSGQASSSESFSSSREVREGAPVGDEHPTLAWNQFAHLSLKPVALEEKRKHGATFSIPPYAPCEEVLKFRAQGSEVNEDSDRDVDHGISSENGDSIDEVDLSELDMIEDSIDTEVVDEIASRMASDSSLDTGDRVVDFLLRRGTVSAEQVKRAQKRKRAENGSTDLWRVLAEEKAIERELVYRTAARLFVYPIADGNDPSLDPELVRSTFREFPPDEQRRLLELGVVPLRAETEGGERSGFLYLFTHDPMREAVHEFVQGLALKQFELQYAPRSTVRELISKAFQQRGEETEPIQRVTSGDGHPGDKEENASEPVTQMSLDTDDRVVGVLLHRGEVEPEQVKEAKRRKQEQGLEETLWRVLAKTSAVDQSVVYEAASRIYAFPVADLDRHPPDPEYARQVVEQRWNEETQEELLELGVVPHRAEEKPGTLTLVTHDPMRTEVHRFVRRLDIDRVELKYAPQSEVNDLMSEAFLSDNEYLDRIKEEDAVDLGQSFEDEEDLIDQEKLEEEINRSTLINLFEATLVEAVRQGASDIHIYPNSQKEVEIHFRVDGRLEHWHREDRVHPEALLSVIKDNSRNVDRFESDAAQDGFIQRDVDGTRIRFRVSIMPIAGSNQHIDSESVVIRVLDDRKVITDLNKLGLGEVALDRFEHAISQPHGMVILTGPTGSGKSTTLVAALHRVIGPEENVLTVEDPVEYIIDGARQIKLSDKLHLEDALRSILRHDPDTVMVGEMRDKTTAELAIKLANTGHLTFSTLHTNDAPSAVSRLYKMDIEPFLIGYAINLVVAQRLIRNLCPECKTVDSDPDPILLKQVGFTEEEIQETDFYVEGEDSRCSLCNGTGYKGRQAIAEALHFSQPIRHMIVEADDMVDEGAIREHAEEEDGMLSLQASARQVVKKGETSIEEMTRVVATDST